jgi:hypothetical protein
MGGANWQLAGAEKLHASLSIMRLLALVIPILPLLFMTR